MMTAGAKNTNGIHFVVCYAIFAMAHNLFIFIS